MAKHQLNSIGILGGSFDPPHKGHLKISQIAMKEAKLRKLYWIITKKNPFKKKGRGGHKISVRTGQWTSALGSGFNLTWIQFSCF